MVKSSRLAGSDERSQIESMRDVWFSMSDAQRFAFIETNIPIKTAKGKIIDLKLSSTQREWLRKGPLFEDFSIKKTFKNRICLKCRNIGASYIMIALEVTLSAWLYPNAFFPIVAGKEDQANAIITSCKNVIRDCKFDIKLDQPIEYQPSSSIRFFNGSTIQTFPGGNPSGIRGPRAFSIYCDEFAFVRRQQEVLSAIDYFGTEGASTSILSTPWGRLNLFWKIWSDKDNYSGWDRFYAPLFANMEKFDVKKPIPEQINSRGLILNAPWLSIDFLEKKRAEDEPYNYANFMQETCGVPMDEVSSAFPEELLNMFTMDHYYIEHRDIERDAVVEKKDIFLVSLDFGATSNNTAAVVFHAFDNKLVVCYTEIIKGTFPEQTAKVQSLVRRFDPMITIGDSTGMGGDNWLTHLMDVVNGAVVGVNYTKKDFSEPPKASNLQTIGKGASKHYKPQKNNAQELSLSNKELFIKLSQKYLAEGAMIVPKNFRRLRDEILGMEKLVYENHIKYSGKNGPVGSDDLSMAWAQGALLYERVFTQDSIEGVGMARQNFMTRSVNQRDRLKPQIKPKQESFEASVHDSMGPMRHAPDKLQGFGKLI